MSFLLARDALKGSAGKAFMVVSGQNIELFGLKKFEANADINASEFKVVGTNVDQSKPGSIKYSGSADVYYGTPAFLRILTEYKKTGRFPVINFQITNEDKGSSVGAQTVAIYNVVLTKIPITLLDDSSDALQGNISFNFGDVEVLQWFNDEPEQLGGN